MDMKKKGFLNKTWRRCRSLGKRSKSWGSGAVAPEGCFWVRVGAEKQKFCIRTECLNHPLFKMLLEEAASEYGFAVDGPLELPCPVDMFMNVLVEMDSAAAVAVEEEEEESVVGGRRWASPARCLPRARSTSHITTYQVLPSPASVY